MKALIALIEALSARMDTLTVRLAELELMITACECSCEKWRKAKQGE